MTRHIIHKLIVVTTVVSLLWGCGGSGGEVSNQVDSPSDHSAYITNSAGDFRDFFGIAWRGSASDNLKYSKQMGYEYIFTTSAAGLTPEMIPYASGMKFMYESPEYRVYPIDRVLDLNKSYTSGEQATYEKFFAWKSNAAFPANLATGWFFSNTTCSVEPDWQQQAVIDYFVEAIIAKAKAENNPAIDFTFGGVAWDVPTPDFWDSLGVKATLISWTGQDSSVVHNGITHEYSTYADGKAAFYKQFFARMRTEFPDAKIIMEPWDIYENYLRWIEERADKTELMPDMLTQEMPGTEFVDDIRIFLSGLIGKNRLGSTTCNSFGEYENRLFAAKAAINGSWFGWYGRFGGSGDMPDYMNVYEVPARLQLIRRIPAWDNSVGIPLASRSWDGSIYRSPNSYADANVIYSHHPKTGKLFAVFLDASGVVTLQPGETVTSVQRTDGFFIEAGDGMADLRISGNTINIISPLNLNKGYVITTK